jgi:hypothetical protein
MDQTRAALGASEGRCAAKQAAVALISAPHRTEDIAMAEASLALAQGNLEEQRAPSSPLEATKLADRWRRIASPFATLRSHQHPTADPDP